MWSFKSMLVILYLLKVLLFNGFHHCQGFLRHYDFYVKEASYERLCARKNILTVNGQFPGPTLYAHKGDTIYVNVHNNGKDNITIHWHGVKLPRYPWSDGPAYITQCPIQPGKNLRQKIIFSTEEGTLWWHAHSNWDRATVHGAIIVYPNHDSAYPFPKPDLEVPIVLGEWWKEDVNDVLRDLLATGGDPRISDALTINGQPGALYPCSKQETFKVNVDRGKTYLLRFINAGLNHILFISIANHPLTVVGIDGSYTKQLTRSFVAISPGQTMDCLLHANQTPKSYYMAIRAYSSGDGVGFVNTTATAIIQYNHTSFRYSDLSLPSLPYYNDTNAAFDFFGSLRSLASKEHPPLFSLTSKNELLIFTISINTFPCANNSCEGPQGSRFGASVNNVSFDNPSIDILDAYYYHIKGVFGERFPNVPPLFYNFTGSNLSSSLLTPKKGTEVKVLNYNSIVELVFQGTNLVAGVDHPMHLHGFSFYVVGYGFGNFKKNKDPKNYNLDDPPLRNTVTVPKNGWVAIRFKADNPGVWFMHCHLERHATWGMETVFIVRDGKGPNEVMLPPPQNMPPC